MLYILLYKRDLWNLQRNKERTRRDFGKLIAKAEKEKQHQDVIGSLISEEIFEVDMLDDRIIGIQIRFLIRQAEKYLVPTPTFDMHNDTWEESKITGRWRWSPETVSNVTKAVREEQKHKREYWQSWVTLSVGVIGALTGLAFGLVALTK